MTTLILILILISIILYVLPWWIASHRKCKHRMGFAVLTIFLGWTFLGWVGALIWAVTGPAE